MREVEELVRKILLDEITEEDLSVEEQKALVKYCEKEYKQIEKETNEARKRKEKALNKTEKYKKAMDKLEKIIKEEED